MTLYDAAPKLPSGEAKALSDYRGKVLLIVNTASKCGFTPQYAGLQSLYETHREQGFEVLAFPCDQFMHQEPGGDAEIAAFCESKFHVTFPVFSKVEVNGAKADPVFVWLKGQKGGLLGSAIKWNFTKFLVGRDGAVISRYSPTTTPSSLEKDVEKALAAA